MKRHWNMIGVLCASIFMMTITTKIVGGPWAIINQQFASVYPGSTKTMEKGLIILVHCLVVFSKESDNTVTISIPVARNLDKSENWLSVQYLNSGRAAEWSLLKKLKQQPMLKTGCGGWVV